MLLLAEPNQEIIWLYVSMEKTLRMDILHSLHHLVSDHKHGFNGKLSFAVIK